MYCYQHAIRFLFTIVRRNLEILTPLNQAFDNNLLNIRQLYSSYQVYRTHNTSTENVSVNVNYYYYSSNRLIFP